MAWSLRLKNFTSRTFVPYLVTVGPPPGREPDLTSPIAPQGNYTIDVNGFNPAFAPEPFELAGAQQQPNVFIVQMALLDPDPAILVVTFRYSVPPGQEGTDPALQPQKVGEFPFLDLTEGAYRLRVGAGLQTFELLPDDGSGDPSPGGKGGCLLWPLAVALPWLSGSPFA